MLFTLKLIHTSWTGRLSSLLFFWVCINMWSKIKISDWDRWIDRQTFYKAAASGMHWMMIIWGLALLPITVSVVIFCFCFYFLLFFFFFKFWVCVSACSRYVLTHWDPTNCSLPGNSLHRIFQKKSHFPKWKFPKQNWWANQEIGLIFWFWNANHVTRSDAY